MLNFNKIEIERRCDAVKLILKKSKITLTEEEGKKLLKSLSDFETFCYLCDEEISAAIKLSFVSEEEKMIKVNVGEIINDK